MSARFDDLKMSGLSGLYRFGTKRTRVMKMSGLSRVSIDTGQDGQPRTVGKDGHDGKEVSGE